MNRLIALPLAAAPFLFGCASNVVYQSASKPEGSEMRRDLLDVYPADVRQAPDQYTNAGVGWAGIILHTDAKPGPDGFIHATTTFEHHYFDWEEDKNFGSLQLNVSPRGEGLFFADWVLRRTDADAGSDAAELYAAPGKLALFYGVPEKVTNDVVVLKYRYLRVVDADHYNTNRLDYGRFGEPFRVIGDGKP